LGRRHTNVAVLVDGVEAIFWHSASPILYRRERDSVPRLAKSRAGDSSNIRSVTYEIYVAFDVICLNSKFGHCVIQIRPLGVKTGQYPALHKNVP
jgi:hypothetical protein